MSLPRQVLPGATYLVTRRCSQRQFLLRPCKLTNEIFLYVLARAVERFGIKIHAFCVLSNHHHIVLTDPDAKLPAFEQYLDSLVARAVNCSLGRWESFWAPPTYSAVRLVTPADVIDKTAYCLANPVEAGLVRRGSEWPGLWSSPEQVGRAPIVARRPAGFFRAESHMRQQPRSRSSARRGTAPRAGSEGRPEVRHAAFRVARCSVRSPRHRSPFDRLRASGHSGGARTGSGRTGFHAIASQVARRQA
jgi:REP element-mobilizing transposase RayT